MTRILTFAGLALTAVGGYVLGRRGIDVRVAVGRARSHPEAETKTTELSFRLSRKPCYDTEFDHLAELEHDERHRVAEEIKGHPLHERRRRSRQWDEDELTTAASQSLTREREDIVAPRPY